METEKQRNVVKEAVLDVSDPMERVFHACEVVFGREGEEAEGVVRIERRRGGRRVGYFEGFAGGKIFFVDCAEAAAVAMGVLTNSDHGVVALKGVRGERK